MSNNTPSAAQVRAALSLLDWDNKGLSEAAGVSVDTIVNVKAGNYATQQRIREKIRRALEARGIEFLENDGLRRRPSDIEIYSGRQRFHDFEDFLQDYLMHFGGDICVSAVNEKLFREYRRDFEAYKENMRKMVENGHITIRILTTEGHFKSTWAKYRWQPPQSASPVAFYAFGDNLALISFENNAPYIVLLKASPFADAYRKNFEVAWTNAKELAEET